MHGWSDRGPCMTQLDWLRLTNLGDSAVLLPAAALVALWLAVRARTRGVALAWLVVLAFDIAVVVATKVAYMGWAIGLPGFDFIGLSGHTALSFLVWPVLGCLAASGARPGVRLAAAGLGFGLALAIAVSRVVVHAHTPIEAVLGGVVGASIALAFLWRFGGRLQAPLSGAVVVVSLAALMLPTYGDRFPSNPILARVACALSGRAHFQVRPSVGGQLRQRVCP